MCLGSHHRVFSGCRLVRLPYITQDLRISANTKLTSSNIYTPINASLKNVEIQMHGNLHLPQNITAVQEIVNASSSGNVYWITIHGDNVNFTGTRNVSTGWVYGKSFDLKRSA